MIGDAHRKLQTSMGWVGKDIGYRRIETISSQAYLEHLLYKIQISKEKETDRDFRRILYFKIKSFTCLNVYLFSRRLGARFDE